VQGAETGILTLSCNGKVTSLLRNRDNSDNRPEPVTKKRLVVNLAERTVTGFLFPAHIENEDPVRMEQVAMRCLDHRAAGEAAPARKAARRLVG
jgi:hypothetical protein